MDQASEAITEILHQGLAQAKFKNSQLNLLKPATEKRPVGAVFMTRTKEDLSQAHGFVCTSEEAVQSNGDCSHWTPNIFRYGTYADDKRRFITGHSEDNLKQINTFVVDADFGSKKPRYSTELFDHFVVKLTDLMELWPTLVLETPHGYQAYYVLATPVFVRRNKNGRMPAVDAAKKVSQTLRLAIKKELPSVDLGANHFGFFRLPQEAMIRWFEPAIATDFATLMDWSKRQAPATRKLPKRNLSHQVEQPWFTALTRAQVPRGDGMLGRNNTLLTLCLAGYSSGWSEDRTFDYADEWNTRQCDPLKNREVRGIVRSAYSGRYQGANGDYIKELMAAYAPGVKVFSGHAWYKVAKPRAQRKTSHLHEWIGDLVRLVRQAAGRTKETVTMTTRELRARLGVSSEMLTRVLRAVEENGIMRLTKTRGRNGGCVMATMVMAGRTVQRKRQEAGVAWRAFNHPTAINEPEKVVNEQLNLWPVAAVLDG